MRPGDGGEKRIKSPTNGNAAGDFCRTFVIMVITGTNWDKSNAIELSSGKYGVVKLT